MLILNEQRPDISLYYLGSKLIEFLSHSNSSGQGFHLSELYKKFNEKNPISFNRFMLTLDWLFMLGVIEEIGEGKLTCTLNR